MMGYDERPDRRYGYGMVIDWWFQQFGALVVTTELWNPESRHPRDSRRSIRRPRTPGRAGGSAPCSSPDEKYGGKLFVPWKPFKHPELGDGEIGGWISKYREQRLARRAAPGRLREALAVRAVPGRPPARDRHHRGLGPRRLLRRERQRGHGRAAGRPGHDPEGRRQGRATESSKSRRSSRTRARSPLTRPAAPLARQPRGRRLADRRPRQDRPSCRATPGSGSGVLDGTMPIPGSPAPSGRAA